MHSPKISVLLSIYNTGPWLPDALDSILAQTLTELEILCVDDGSTDNSLEILMEYAGRDPRFRILCQENAGQSVARNKAAAEASGEWLYFMDSDDTLEPDALATLYDRGTADQLQMVFMNTSVFPDTPEWAEQAAHNYEVWKSDRTYPDIYTGQELFRLFKENGDFVPPAWTYLIRRSFYKEKELSFYPGIQREDELFQIRALFLADRVGKVDLELVNHRYRSSSIMTQTLRLDYPCGDLVVALELFRLAGECADDEALYRQLLDSAQTMYTMAARDYLALAPEEQAKVSTLPAQLRMPFEILLLGPGGAVSCEQAKIALDRANHENIRLQTTLSYRLGRAVTSIPRKLRDVIKR